MRHLQHVYHIKDVIYVLSLCSTESTLYVHESSKIYHAMCYRMWIFFSFYAVEMSFPEVAPKTPSALVKPEHTFLYVFCFSPPQSFYG